MATPTKQKKTVKKAAPKKDAGQSAMEATIFNTSGKKVGNLSLPENIFGVAWNADLVHQVVTSMQANARRPWAHTKDRGEVRGGGKKPWKQKGTGRARHGSTRSPIWVHGGVAHGPRNEKSYAKKINRQVRQKALLSVLSRKWKDGEVIFLDKIDIETPKAARAKEIVSALVQAGYPYFSKTTNAALLAMPSVNKPVAKSFANFSNIETTAVQDLNPVSVLAAKYLIIMEPEAAFAFLSKKQVVKKYEHSESHINVARSEQKTKTFSARSLS